MYTLMLFAGQIKYAYPLNSFYTFPKEKNLFLILFPHNLHSTFSFSTQYCCIVIS